MRKSHELGGGKTGKVYWGYKFEVYFLAGFSIVIITVNALKLLQNLMSGKAFIKF